MKNSVQPGNAWNVLLAVAVLSGGVVVMGDTAGVAVTSGEIGDTIAVSMEGVFSLPKSAGTAMVQGKKVYWDATAGVVTTTASGNVQLGYVAQTGGASAPALSVNVSLVPA